MPKYYFVFGDTPHHTDCVPHPKVSVKKDCKHGDNILGNSALKLLIQNLLDGKKLAESLVPCYNKAKKSKA